MKSGFVNIVGSPNVGKSTLMNRLVGERISIITSKSQTTRHRILGIVNGEDFQIVYSDTPGILRPNYRLQESMMRQVRGAVEDADVILYVTDVTEQGVSERTEDIVSRILNSSAAAVVVINKIDLSDPETVNDLVLKWQSALPQARVVAASAKLGFGVEGILSYILELLPQGEPFYERDALTDRSLRFFASEIIREKILLNYDKEIPYSVEVVVESYSEGESLDRIQAVIYVSRQSQKGIVIGHRGEKLKRVGTAARHDLEDFLGKKVFLELFVKVADGWRDNDNALKKFGYEE